MKLETNKACYMMECISPMCACPFCTHLVVIMKAGFPFPQYLGFIFLFDAHLACTQDNWTSPRITLSFFHLFDTQNED